MVPEIFGGELFWNPGEECEKKPYHYGKTIIAQGEAFCRYQDGKEIASYVDHGDVVLQNMRNWSWLRK